MNPQKKTVDSHRSDKTHLNVSELAVVMARPAGQALRILRMKQLVERTGLSRATLYVLISTDPTFPKKISLTERAVGFLETEVDAWIAARAESRVPVLVAPTNIDPHPGRSRTDIARETAKLSADLARAQMQLCSGDCPTLTVRRLRLAAEIAALGVESDEAKRREAEEDRRTSQNRLSIRENK